MRIAVCEDEREDRSRLVSCLEAECGRRGLAAEVMAYQSGKKLLAEAGKEAFRVYFLDILLPGINGVEVAGALRSREPDSAIVFITSSKDYYAEGFALAAAHYLVKPFTAAGVKEALDRCLRQVGEGERYVELTVNRECRRILLSDLVWAESRDKVCYLHTHTGEYRSYLKLDELESRLNDRRFLRCHRSFLVNMDEAEGLKKGFFSMTDSVKIPLRQVERANLRRAYEDYLFEKMRGRQ